jgi:hypothetical protein
VGTLRHRQSEVWYEYCLVGNGSTRIQVKTEAMDTAEIYAKTELGLQELKERHLKLPVLLRSLLIMIDGNRTVADVLEKARALQLDDKALAALEAGGLIAKKYSAPSAAATETVEVRRTEDEVERFLKAQQLMSDATNKHLGFRGYGLMMRLQKTANVRDLRDLLPDFAAALVKRAGLPTATPIVTEVEQLIAPKS